MYLTKQMWSEIHFSTKWFSDAVQLSHTRGRQHPKGNTAWMYTGSPVGRLFYSESQHPASCRKVKSKTKKRLNFVEGLLYVSTSKSQGNKDIEYTLDIHKVNSQSVSDFVCKKFLQFKSMKCWENVKNVKNILH